MKKVIVSTSVALVMFLILNFFYSNVGGEAFQYPLVFKFTIPYILTLNTVPIPVGFMLISAFCIGMMFLPILQIVPAIFRGAQVRAREKRIKELERELENARLEAPTPGPGSDVSLNP